MTKDDYEKSINTNKTYENVSKLLNLKPNGDLQEAIERKLDENQDLSNKIEEYKKKCSVNG